MSLLDEAHSLPSVEEPARKSPSRSRTIQTKRVAKHVYAEVRQAASAFERVIPATRAECLQGEDAQRPCPYVSCRHHLYLGVNERTGSVKLNFPHMEVWDLPESCALDVADRGEMTLEAVGELMSLTRERVRQLETSALEKLRVLSELAAVNEGEL